MSTIVVLADINQGLSSYEHDLHRAKNNVFGYRECSEYVTPTDSRYASYLAGFLERMENADEFHVTQSASQSDMARLATIVCREQAVETVLIDDGVIR